MSVKYYLMLESNWIPGDKAESFDEKNNLPRMKSLSMASASTSDPPTRCCVGDVSSGFWVWILIRCSKRCINFSSSSCTFGFYQILLIFPIFLLMRYKFLLKRTFYHLQPNVNFKKVRRVLWNVDDVRIEVLDELFHIEKSTSRMHPKLS